MAICKKCGKIFKKEGLGRKPERLCLKCWNEKYKHLGRRIRI